MKTLEKWTQGDFFQTSLQEDIPVSLLVTRANNKVKKIQDTSGQTCLELSKKLNQDGSFVKMFMDTYDSDWTPFSMTWRVKDTQRGRLLFQLARLAPRTKEKESLLWPTPRQSEYKDCGPVGSKSQKDMAKRRKLCAVVKMWPTPQSSDHRDRGNMSNPCIQKRVKQGRQLNLSMVVSEKSGQLNPTWVEWLMGYPLGWTDLKD